MAPLGRDGGCSCCGCCCGNYVETRISNYSRATFNMSIPTVIGELNHDVIVLCVQGRGETQSILRSAMGPRAGVALGLRKITNPPDDISR